MGAMAQDREQFRAAPICALCLLVITVALFSGVIFRYADQIFPHLGRGDSSLRASLVDPFIGAALAE